MIVTEEMDNQLINTKELCSAILVYNSENVENMWLKDVDFSCFVEDSKNSRNLDEHLGITGALQDLYRVYFNLNKICRALTITDFTLNLKLNEKEFDYMRFDACMDAMQGDDRRYILLADAMHNVEKKYLEAFLQIPWSVILDFDGASDMGGLQSVFESDDYIGRHYTLHSYSEFTTNSTVKYMNAHIKLCEDDLSRRFTAKKLDDNDSTRIPVIMNRIRDSIHSKATIVVTGLQTERVKDICKQIKRMFLDTDIIFLTSQGERQLLEKTETDEREASGNITAVNEFDNSIFSVMKSVYENRELFLKKVSKDSDMTSDKYVFNTLDKTRLTVIDMELLHDKELSFEFLHLNIGKNMCLCNEWEFYHGDIVNWETIHRGFVEPLVSTDKLKAFEEEIKSNQSGSCFTIYHLPGFGGTTLGRIVAWNLHEEMPVLRLKEYETIQTLVKDIGDIYTYLFEKYKFLILIDENDFSLKQMQELEKMVLDSEYSIKALFVKRISEVDAKKKQKQMKSNQKNEIIFSTLEIRFRNILKERCRQLLIEKGQGDCYEIRDKHMNNTINERQKCALIINLYLLEDNFNLKTYVRKFFEKLTKDSDGDRDLKMFAFIAMLDYFSNLKMPAAYIARYLDSSGKLKPKNVEDKYDDYNGLFLKILSQKTGNICYGIKHYLIAQEMLRQILEKNQKGTLPDLVIEFIDFLCQIIQGMDKIDDSVKDIITWLFTDKTKSRWYNSPYDEYENSFTSLLMELDEYKRLDVIEYLANKFGCFINDVIPKGESRLEYKLLAHIYAQRARIRSKSQRMDDSEEQQDIDVDNYMQDTMDVICAENICEYDLEHMLGMCYLDKAKRLGEKEILSQKLCDDILFDIIDKSIERFNYTIWYGSPDYGIPCKLDAITTAINAIIKCNKIKLDKRIEKLCEIPKAKEYVDEGIKMIQDIDEYSLNTKAKTISEKRKDEFEHACFPNKSSEFLQRLDELSMKLNDNDYEGKYMVSMMTVYAYEKKHYMNEYRRSSLIHKALIGDSKAAEDAERVFSHLDKIVKMSKEHPVSYATYNRWFEYAKYMQISLAKAYEQACNWKYAESCRKNTASQRNNLIRPCYYLFVIQLLRYCEGDSVTDKDVLSRKQDLNMQISISRANEVVQDWYSKRKGLGHLYSKEWIDVQNVDRNNDIAEVQGKVVHVDGEKYNYGYLRIISPNIMNKWSKAPKGMLYNKDSDVYFSEKQSRIISEKDKGSRKYFKFGFTYSKLIASMNSLENRNIAKTIVEDLNQSDTKIEEKSTEFSDAINLEII